MVHIPSPDLDDPEKYIKFKMQMSWIVIHKIVQKISTTARIGLDKCPVEIASDEKMLKNDRIQESI